MTVFSRRDALAGRDHGEMESQMARSLINH